MNSASSSPEAGWKWSMASDPGLRRESRPISHGPSVAPFDCREILDSLPPAPTPKALFSCKAAPAGLQCIHQPDNWHRSVSPQRSFLKLKSVFSCFLELTQTHVTS